MSELSDPRHAAYLDWLLTEKSMRVPSTKTAYAEKVGVNIRTLRDWEAKPEFIKAYEAGVRLVTGGPEKYAAVMAALHATAIEREHRQHTQAAKLWLDSAGYLQGQVKAEPADATKLTNEELDKLIAEAALETKEARTPLKVVKG